MTKNFTGLPTQHLHDAVQNTIRIFNEYRLDKKIYPGSIYKVFSTEAGGIFYDLQYFKLDDGVQISVKAGKIFGKITEAEAVTLVQNLLTRIDAVLSGKIIMTADVANRDVYKSGQTVTGLFALIKLIVAIVAIIMALMVLMR